ncbi:MAG TPA: response regulator [Candidatus Methylomirabilis sp.]|nr:response regulator [Candidatus Methylomirabilis sp.]
MAPSESILIVDDDPAVCEALTSALAPQYRVLAARNGAEALEIAGQHALDLVLLDYLLPDGSGLALLHDIQRISPAVPIILMTGFGSEDVAVESFRSGVRDYLKKPFSIPDLVARVERILEAARTGGPVPSSAIPAAAPVSPGAELPSPNKNLQRAIAYVEARLHMHVSLDQVAREAGMSKFHFCRIFKGGTGLTFREFLARRRIARAIDLLRDRQRSLTDIYLEVGFKDMSHFSRVFRRLIGQSPSHYRRVAAESGWGEGFPTEVEEPRQTRKKGRVVQEKQV